MKRFAYSLLAALTLTSCSSGSGGGKDNSNLFILNNPFEVPTQAANSSSNANSGNTQATNSNQAGSNTNSQSSSQTNSTTNSQNSSQTGGNVNVNNNVAVTPAATTTTQTPTPFKETIFAPSADPKALSGGHLAVKADGSTQGTALKNYRDEELNELVVGDTHIRLFNVREDLSGTYLDKFKALSNSDVTEGKNGEVSGFVGGWGNLFTYAGFFHTRFGVYRANGVDHLFAQGFATPLTEAADSRNGRLSPMPTSGRNTYANGQALYGKDGNYEQLKAVALADFDAKTITVSLLDQLGGSPKVQFNAQIDGNTFKGDSGDIHSRGGFFGSGADEATGLFYHADGAEKGKNGVFGVNSPRRER